MKGYRLLTSDIRAAMQKQKFFLIAGVIFALQWISGYLEICSDPVGIKSNLEFSLGEMFLYCFQGIDPLLDTDGAVVLRLPIGWLSVFLGAHFSVIGYAENFTLYGQQYFFRSGNRSWWWISKCIWNVSTTVLYFALGFTVYGLLTFFRGGSLKLEKMEGFLLLIILVCISWNLFQMYISMYVGTFIGILISIVTLLSSVFIYSPLLPGNYLMYLRTEKFMGNGMKTVNGYYIVSLLTVIAIVGGILKSRHLDYLVEE